MLAVRIRRKLADKSTQALNSRPQDAGSDFKRRVIFIVLVVAIVITGMAAIWEARVILLVMFAGCLGAVVLGTLTSLLQASLRIPRILAFVAILVALGLAIAFGVWL